MSDIHCAVLDKDEPLVDGFQVSKYFSFGYSLRKLGLRETRGGSVSFVEKKKFRSDRKNQDKDKGKFDKTIYSELKITFSLSDFRTLTVRIHGHVDMKLAGELCYLSYGRLVIPQQNKVFTVMSWKI